MTDYILSVDLGTTSCKTVLFDTGFNVVAESKRAYETVYPHAGWAEQPAWQWWDALCENTLAVLEKSAVDPLKIIAVGIDAFSTTVLPVDRDGEPLRPGLIWMDRRAKRQSDWIAENLGEDLREISGNVSDAGNIAPKIMWLKENEPELYNRTKMFLHANGYLVYRLSGQFSMDASEAGLSQLCNTGTSRYSDVLIDGCGIDRAKLPPIYNCTDVVGKVTAEAAQQTGLAVGTPVIAGAMDNVAAALGAGISKGGQVFISGGTVVTNNICLSEPRYNRNLHTYSHIVPGTWITAGGIDFGGAALKWFNENVLTESQFSEVDQLADTSVCAKSSIIFLPYMVGQRGPLWNDNTTGVLMGLKPSTNRQDLIRSMMEGAAYGSRHVLSVAEDEGLEISKIKMTGGTANSATWVQIFSDVIGKPIEVPGTVDLPPLGIAIAAAYGVGAITGFEEGFKKIPVRGSFAPNAQNHAYYSEMYDVFRSLYQNIIGEYNQLAAIQKKYREINQEAFTS